MIVWKKRRKNGQLNSNSWSKQRTPGY